MDLESVIWDRSQKGKQVLCINSYLWNLKNGTNDLIYPKQKRDTGIENKCMDIKEERRCGRRNWEIGIDTYTLLIHV